MAERGGQEGNTNAVKENRLVTDTLRRVAKQGPDKLRTACQKVLDKAAEGDLACFNVLADRLDGKPLQSVEVNKRKSTRSMTDEELIDLIAEARAALKESHNGAGRSDSGESAVH